MAPLFRVQVFEQQQTAYAEEFDEAVELGRQNDSQEKPFSSQRDETGRLRVVIARLTEDCISRRHALLEPAAPGRVSITNLSAKLPIFLSASALAPEASCELALPAVLTFGRRTTVRVEEVGSSDVTLAALPDLTPRPGFPEGITSRLTTLASPALGMDMDTLIRWIQAMMGVMQSAASSSDFFAKAARVLVDHVGLNSGRVLIYEKGEWKPRALESAPRVTLEPNWQPSQQVLNQVLKEKRTFWQVPGQPSLEAVSLIGVRAVVAAPILDPQGEVLGVLYGDRRSEARAAFAPPITKVQALLVELLATGVAAGLARLEQEQAALAARVQFEQFFTPELSRQLTAQPDLLKGRDCEVSILFCDIRGFSRISERLGPAGTDDWIRHVMDALSECVLAHRGVLVDYVGDEVMAMWGAPEDQPDHAQLACRAALAMLAQLPILNQRWETTLQEPLDLGIGINTGVARVGNTGSRRKFKYGPLGNTVNLASRVQGTTKYLKAKVLITNATYTQLDATFPTRRLSKVMVVNIAEPVDLYELMATDQPSWAGLQQGYERALEHFERQEFRKAARILGNLQTLYPNDGPSLVLLARVVQALIEPASFDPVWKMKGK